MAVAQVPFALVEALGLDERQASSPAAVELEPSEPTERAGGMTGWPAARRGRRAIPVNQTASSTAPQRAGLVLVALILVAGGRQPEPVGRERRAAAIGEDFDSSQTTLNLIAVGYSLGLAASVLYLGAIGDRYGRKLLLVLGHGAVHPGLPAGGVRAERRGAHRGADARRRLGRHGLPDDARPDHRAVVRAGPDEVDRALVGDSAAPSRRLARCSPARCWSTSGGARCSCSPCRSRPSRS